MCNRLIQSQHCMHAFLGPREPQGWKKETANLRMCTHFVLAPGLMSGPVPSLCKADKFWVEATCNSSSIHSA